MLVKIHQSYRIVVAVCDSDLFGKILEGGEKQLDLTGQFFKGEEKTELEVEDILEDMKREDASFYIVGEDSCDLAMKIGMISQEGIIFIQEVPIALVLL